MTFVVVSQCDGFWRCGTQFEMKTLVIEIEVKRFWYVSYVPIEIETYQYVRTSKIVKIDYF